MISDFRFQISNLRKLVLTICALIIILPAGLQANEKRIDKTDFIKKLFMREKVVRVALSMTGKDYWPGGQSDDYGYDCSGLTRHVYAKVGIAIPRKSVNQYRNALKIPFGGLRKGDLVFFNTRGLGPTHVGIYLGYGKFIHAPGVGKKVRIDSMNKKYWKARFVKGGGYIH